MALKYGLKSIGYDIDPQIADKFDKFCNKHSGDPKSWLLEFAIARLVEMSDEDFKRLYDPFYQWRSLRKREIKLQTAKKK